MLQIKLINISRIIYYTNVKYPYFVLFFGTMNTQRGKTQILKKVICPWELSNSVRVWTREWNPQMSNERKGIRLVLKVTCVLGDYRNNVLHYKSRSCWETRASGTFRLAVRGVWLKRKQAFHLFTWRENIEGERDRGANHVSPSNYDKASLSRAHSSSRRAGPQPEDILVPANTTKQGIKLWKVSVES